MKIRIGKNKWKFPIWIPNGLILNRLTVKKFAKQIEEETDKKIDPTLLLKLKKEIRDFKKRNPNWKFIEVESKDGTNFEIIL